MFNFLKKLGPGILFAGAAIGVSHLVQSTRAGADFGIGLIWALLLVNLFKFPFFQYGPRYANATGESLLDGYKKLGKNILSIYILISLATMFTIQTAVTIVTAGIASSLTNNIISVEIWTIIILIICTVLLYFGKYKMLDRMIKIVISILALSTIVATCLAFNNFSYDFKLYRKFEDKGVSLRSFCTNNNAAFVAVEETYGDVSYNGHAKKDPKYLNGMTNFASNDTKFGINEGKMGNLMVTAGNILCKKQYDTEGVLDINPFATRDLLTSSESARVRGEA